MITPIAVCQTTAAGNAPWKIAEGPYPERIKICHEQPEDISVHVPASLLENNDELPLTLQFTSKTRSTTKEGRQYCFKSFYPNLKINNAFIMGNYAIDLDTLPRTQTREIRIKTRYLKAGRNTFTFSFVWRSRKGSGRCRTKCCGYTVDKLAFAGVSAGLIATRFTSEPAGASLYLDDHYKGTTPVAVNLAPGAYRVRLSKEGYLTAASTFRVSPESPVSHSVLETQSLHTVTVTSDPVGATIYWDGRLAGKTPTTLETTVPDHRLRLEKPGFKPLEENLTVKRSRTLDYRLEALPGDKAPKPVAPAEPVDNAGPLVTLKNKAKLATVAASRVTVSGTASDPSGVAIVYVNRREAQLDGQGNFRSPVLLKPGENEVAIVAVDVYDNRSTTKLKIRRQSLQIAEKRIALIIGNANYLAGGVLKNPINDARAMQAVLSKLGFDAVSLEDASQKEMKKAIDAFGARLKDYDVGLFFYAGHGVQVDGANYLIPVDANLSSENDVEYDCVDVGRVLGKMEDAANDVNIIVLDACRDNPFERSWSRSSRGKGLAFLDAPTGSLIAYATSPGRTAADGADANGLYTAALLEHIGTPGIGIETVFKRVRATVVDHSRGLQTPWESTSLIGEFRFSNNYR